MSYETLIAEHKAIDRLAQALLAVIRASQPSADDAVDVLRLLATLLRNHLEGDAIIYDIAAATRGGRHQPAADTALAEIELLKQEWGDYLYRWPPARIAIAWSDFARESGDMLDRLRERMLRDGAILYSLALFYAVIVPKR